MVHEEVRQGLVAVGAKLEKYDNRIEQNRQNRLIESNQKRLLNEFEGTQRESVITDAEESRRFWSDIWDQAVAYRENTDCLRKMKNELGELTVQDDIHIEIKKVRKQIRKMPNWKSPGPDCLQGYWIKNLSNLHNSIALQLDRCLQENSLPKWMVTGKTLLCIKEIQKGNLVSNFRPITCLPLIWKLLTSILAEEMYEHLEKTNSLPWEQKRCRKGTTGTKDQPLIDKMKVKDCKRRLTSLAVAWIDYRKAYDMVPHSWIQKCIEMLGKAVNVRSFVNASMTDCK